jgi:hypothetical protein
MRRSHHWIQGENACVIDVGATVFREDGSAAKVTIIELTFDGCHALSGSAFVVGERLRIYQSGQGCIEAEVEWASDDRAELRFLTDCQV